MAKINFKQPKYVLPLIVLPFLFLAYYVKGQYGSKESEQEEVQAPTDGLNTELPDVGKRVQDGKVKDKLDAYRDAYKKSDKLSPLAGLDYEPSAAQTDYTVYSDEDMIAVNAKRQLDSLNKALVYEQNQLRKEASQAGSTSKKRISFDSDDNSGQKELMKQLLALEKSKNAEESAQPRKNSIAEQTKMSMIDQYKIIDSLEAAREAKAGMALNQNTEKKQHNRFDPSEDSNFKPLSVSLNRRLMSSDGFNTVRAFKREEAISAIIDEDTKSQAGSRVRIRLLQDVFIANQIIPTGSYLYAQVTGFQTSRVNLTITQVFHNNQSFPVELDIFDYDGYLGLYVPGSVFREFSKQIGTQGTQGLSQVMTADQTGDAKQALITQLFRTSTTTAANMIRKEKAFLKYNYQVFLKERKK